MQVAKEALPLLIQMVVILWDHYTPLVQDQARELLVHLLHELVISKLDDTAGTQKSVAEDLAEMIRHQDLKVSWAYDDNNSTDGDDMDISVPSPMVLIITEAVSIFSAVFPTIRDDWGKLSLVWATSCPVRHLACRSFQIFRCLQISLDQQMLAGILARLSNTIADDETDILSFSLEILITLRTMVTELQSVDVLRFPQFFWTTCACLNTIHEPEFRESLKILDKLLDKVDLGNTDVVSLLREASPQNWEGDFEGVQSLVFKGMRSGDSHDLSLRLLERLVQLPSNELVGDQSRYALTILANLPRLLHNFPKLAYEPQVSSASEALAKVCAEQGWDKLSAALDQYSRRTYRSEKDFLAQITSGIKEYFFPDLEFAILTFMMGSMTNELAWFKIKMLQVLSAIIPDIDMRKQEISSQGPEVISPLLRLLQTEFCPNALEVLDNVMTVTGAPMDKHHLRMSMAGSHSTKAFRKEYAKTQCLYGIPEESGWAIPMPAVYSAYTRSNVHSVFYTCSAALQANLAAAVATADGVDFKTEEEAYGGYPADYRTATMLSDDGRDIGNMGDLVMKLDSLDDFFEDDLTEANNTTASRTLGGGLSSSAEAVRETVYEEQTLPILHKSLHRNASLTSFQTGLADHTTTTSTSTTTATTTTNTTTHTNTSNTSISSASTPTSVTHNNNTTNSSSSGIGNGGKATSIRDPAIMTPAAFASQPPSSRSGVHSRSVTSGASFSNRSLQSSPSTEEQHDALSDEEAYANIRSPAQERQFSLENIIRPIASNTRSGLRSGLRRLTSGHNDGRDRERTTESTTRLPMQSQRSPKVPKIPEL